MQRAPVEHWSFVANDREGSSETSAPSKNLETHRMASLPDTLAWRRAFAASSWGALRISSAVIDLPLITGADWPGALHPVTFPAQPRAYRTLSPISHRKKRHHGIPACQGDLSKKGTISTFKCHDSGRRPEHEM